MTHTKSALDSNLLQAAVQAQACAHAPYSNKYIGSAVRFSDGRIFGGCNVENASYGGTVCAERVAIFKGISEGAKPPLAEVLVVSTELNPWPPCGFCRQVIAEFADVNTKILISNPKGDHRVVKFTDFFPEAFTPSHLNK